MSDPHWPRAAEWATGDHSSTARSSMAVVGAPLHVASISPSRADLAPGAIRAALARFSLHDPTRSEELFDVAVRDAGDLPLADRTPEEAFDPLSEAVRALRNEADAVVILGGDNSVTRPAVRGVHDLERCGLITFDAHFDLRETTSGLSNGNPIRALLEDGVPGPNIIQIGIQPFSNSPDHAQIAASAGIEVIARDEVERRGIGAVVDDALTALARTTDVIYVDFDIDVLDRAFAPATPGARPGGLMPAELFRAASSCGAHPSVVAADIVEVSPPDDVNEVTVMAAAKVLLSFASGLSSRNEAQ